MKKIAIITGASSGIGMDFAKIIDKKEMFIDEIWLIGRDKRRLKNLSEKLKKQSRCISLDLSRPASLNSFRKMIETEDIIIDILVNSAGFGVDGFFDEMSYTSIRDMIRVNVEALTSITYNCIPKMVHGSRIINIASSVAFLPQPIFNVYASTKSYVYSFTRALRYELRKKGILVTAVCPGPVDTKFFRYAQDKKISFKNLPRANSRKVAFLAYKENLMNKEVSTYSLVIKIFRIMCKIVPHTVLLKGYLVYISARNKSR